MKAEGTVSRMTVVLVGDKGSISTTVSPTIPAATTGSVLEAVQDREFRCKIGLDASVGAACVGSAGVSSVGTAEQVQI